MSGCQLDHTDFRVIFAATNHSLENKLPSLTSLAFSPDDVDVSEDIIIQLLVDPWENLNALSVSHISKANSVFEKLTDRNICPNLKVLKVSDIQTEVSLPGGLHSLSFNLHNKTSKFKMQVLSKNVNRQALFHLDLSFSQIKDSLIYLVRHKLPSLERLILHRCRLNLQDFQHLAQADEANRLPKLKHLDIAFNDYFHLGWLLKSKWQGMECLEVDWMNICEESNLFHLVKTVKEGSLSSLRKLFFTPRAITNMNLNHVEDVSRLE